MQKNILSTVFLEATKCTLSLACWSKFLIYRRKFILSNPIFFLKVLLADFSRFQVGLNLATPSPPSGF